ncbi:unnamed protein product, partial [Phaeothamnion confervicola]
AGTWRCESCLVHNAEGAQKCASCETPNPHAAAAENGGDLRHGALAAGKAAADGSFGAGGFTFGSPLAA